MQDETRSVTVPAGLAGVAVVDTAIGDVDGQQGRFHYGPYDAVALARQHTLEEVWHLLLTGALPSAAGGAALARRIAEARRLPAATARQLPALVEACPDVAAALRPALSLAAAERGLAPVLDLDDERRGDDALAIAALVPVLVAGLYRARHGLAPLPSRPELSHAADYLWMLTGREPDAADVRALEQYLILTLDHGLNSSTFAARVVASTGADLGACVLAGLTALSGPLHGGAPSRALDALDAIGRPEHAGAWVRRALARGERIMGFGHRVYRTHDPRAVHLRDVARARGGELAELATAVEATVVDALAEAKPGRRLYANVEFYAAVVLEQCGIPRELFTPTFAIGRTIGWGAHVVEQAATGRLFRPTARYVGPSAPAPPRDDPAGGGEATTAAAGG